jgi:hypothetical protein
MSELPPEVGGGFGSFRSAWRLEGMNGYIIRKRVIGSDWYIFWLCLEGRWEYLPFGMVESRTSNRWRSLLGDEGIIAAAIGHSQMLYLVVDCELVGTAEEMCW